MTRIQKIAMRVSGVAALVSCVMLATATSRAVTITADVWTPNETIGTVTYGYPAPGAISIGFPPATTVPPNCRSTVVASSSQSPAYFAGDFIGTGISTVKFTFTGTGELPSSQSYVVLKGKPQDGYPPGTGREWFHGLNLSTVAGQATDNLIAMQRADWITFDSGDLDALWAQDMVAVESLGVRLKRNSESPSPAHSFTISAFGIESTKTPGGLDALQQALFDRFGVHDVASVPAEFWGDDTDHDGMSDLDEIRAVFEPGYFNTIFKVNVQSTADGISIQWACVKDKIYTVWRADSMNGEFVPVYSAVATTTGWWTPPYIDTEAEFGTSYFYMVVQE